LSAHPSLRVTATSVLLEAGMIRRRSMISRTAPFTSVGLARSAEIQASGL
jgi:hypothetical protein